MVCPSRIVVQVPEPHAQISVGFVDICLLDKFNIFCNVVPEKSTIHATAMLPQCGDVVTQQKYTL